MSQEAGTLRQPKHLEMDSALNQLSNIISEVEDFLDQLNNAERPKDAKTPEGKSNPSWNKIYSSLTERIKTMTDRLVKAHAILKEMLF